MGVLRGRGVGIGKPHGTPSFCGSRLRDPADAWMGREGSEVRLELTKTKRPRDFLGHSGLGNGML